MSELSNALKEQNPYKIEQLAHRLCGSAGLFGYEKMSDFGAMLEENAKLGNFQECQNIFAQALIEHKAIMAGSPAINCS